MYHKKQWKDKKIEGLQKERKRYEVANEEDNI